MTCEIVAGEGDGFAAEAAIEGLRELVEKLAATVARIEGRLESLQASVESLGTGSGG